MGSSFFTYWREVLLLSNVSDLAALVQSAGVRILR